MRMAKELEITGMAYGGAGVAKHEGSVYFVSDAVVGDVVIPNIVRSKKNVVHASVDTYCTRSRLRDTPRCQFGRECGGCQWTDIAAATQLSWKESFIRDSFSRIGRVSFSKPIGIHALDTAGGYRSRLRVRLEISSGRTRMGYYAEGSHQLVPIDECFVATSGNNHVLRRLASFQPVQIKNAQCEAELVEGDSGAIYLSVFDNDSTLIGELMSFLGEECAWIGDPRRDHKLPLFVHDLDQNFSYFAHPGRFVQANRILNRKLRHYIVEYFKRSGLSHALDLYCGNGNFSLPLSPFAKSVTGIESNLSAVSAARHAAELGGASNCLYDRGDVARELGAYDRSVEFLIMDPPRVGAKPALESILKLSPAIICYVSCDPTTLARDLGALQKGYALEEVSLWDFFPDTFHVETLAILHKR